MQPNYNQPNLFESTWVYEDCENIGLSQKLYGSRWWGFYLIFYICSSTNRM